MSKVHLVITGPEEAYDTGAEFWCANQLMAVTVLHEGRVHLQVDPRADGSPWLLDAATLHSSLAEAKQRLESY